MPSGGARNRSGPQSVKGSARTDARGILMQLLPAEGYKGRVPKFPLRPRRVYRWEQEDGRRFQVFDEEETGLVADREKELWRWAWRTPQATMWIRQSERWRMMAIAQWVRISVICEGDEATAADKGSVHRFADQIGLTPAGLRENGWEVAPDEVEEKRKQRSEPEPENDDEPEEPRRLSSVPG